MQYRPRLCGRCELPAVYRLCLVDLDDNPAGVFKHRSHYRCAECFHAGLTPPALMIPAKTAQLVVIDPAFTAAVAPDGLCLCGLPANHRYPDDGSEPRGCIDETVVIATGYRPEVPLPSRDGSGSGR